MTVLQKLAIAGGIQFPAQYCAPIYTTTVSLDWSNGNVQKITLANGGQTFTFANPIAGGRYVLVLQQPASGAAGTVTWPTINKIQILVIDLQALYSGRVRIGFDIGGTIIYVHQFNHANVVATPYIQTANLPVRCGMTCTGTVSTTMRYICASVLSEGGQDETNGYGFCAEGTVTAGNGTRTHVLSVRPKALFNGFANRALITQLAVDVLVTGNSPVIWELCVGQALTTPTYADVNTTYSVMESVAAGTLSGNPAVVIDRGYVAAGATVKGATNTLVPHRYPITLDHAGAVRDLGTLAVLVTGVGGTSACRVSASWKEIR